MADNLPEPKSRKESYLAKAAGMSVTIPEEPESREEQYLAAIAEGGGGGGTSNFDELTNRPKYNGTAMTGETDIPVAPTVVQTTGISTTNVMSQNAVSSMVFGDDPERIRIGNKNVTGPYSISIGYNAKGTTIAASTTAVGSSANALYEGAVGIGSASYANAKGSIALGARSMTSQQGQMDVGTTVTDYGYNSSNYRLITGVYDGQSAHDAATYGQMNTRLGGLTLLTISQTDYDNLSTKDPDTLYVITGA